MGETDEGGIRGADGEGVRELRVVRSALQQGLEQRGAARVGVLPAGRQEQKAVCVGLQRLFEAGAVMGMVNESSSVKALERQIRNTKRLIDRFNKLYYGQTWEEHEKLFAQIAGKERKGNENETDADRNDDSSGGR